MERLIRWFVNNKVVSNLLMVLIIVTGATTIPSLKMEVFPEIELNVINVTTVYPGATPSDVEQAICIKNDDEYMYIHKYAHKMFGHISAIFI